MRKNMPYTAIALFLLISLSGCVVHRGAEPPADASPAVNSGLRHERALMVFVGIGSAAGTKNRTLLRAMADNEAREALAKVLERYVDTLAEAVKANARAHVYALTRAAMHRAIITDHWSAPDLESDRLYSRCTLSLSVFQEALAAYRALEIDDREAMLSGSQSHFERLATD